MATRGNLPNAPAAARPQAAERFIIAAALALSLLGTQAACSPQETPSGGSTPPPTTTTTTTTTAAPPPDATASWTRYSDAVDHFSLRYPPTWQQRTCVSGAHTGFFVAPTTAALGICNSGFGGQMSVAAVPGDERLTFHLSGTGAATTAATVDGVTGTRESATATASDMGPPAGTRLVVYLFYTGGLTYRCSYSQWPTGDVSSDVLADFDLMVTHTLRFSA